MMSSPHWCTSEYVVTAFNQQHYGLELDGVAGQGDTSEDVEARPVGCPNHSGKGPRQPGPKAMLHSSVDCLGVPRRATHATHVNSTPTQ
jgi:hypothetical protein